MTEQTDTSIPQPPTAQETEKLSCPDWLPAKFWDGKAGEVRVEALARSYRELEKRLSQQKKAKPEAPAEPAPVPENTSLPKNPAGPDNHEITLSHDLFQPDPEVNQVLFDAGLSKEQVQLVYDLAESRLLPIAEEVALQARTEWEHQRLKEHFGGADKWGEACRQLRDWGRGHLPPEAYEALASSYEGILALHRMMSGGGEPGLAGAGDGQPTGSEGDLRKMMRSPRYWQEQDPGMIRRVSDGFRRLYAR